MARIQILELPVEHHGEDMITPYLLVIDEAPRDEAAFEALRQDLADNDLVARTGARAVLCFEGTMEIPANGTYPPDAHTMDVHVDGSLGSAIRSAAEETVRQMKARADSAATR
ncbi:hypothetical protein [Streptomyces justiciae]|uniref:Uncharacterized protein n=1 Tax=Streptomyces justiciae TaxID=2780140 RepID=A0ABU3M8T9_9ACTN|nr:hypothetical protein [Streptomyces justiciae]MDT7847207.1 hypothetical protein [Streptomyces justiciae]